jgi:hypothetical protein
MSNSGFGGGVLIEITAHLVAAVLVAADLVAASLIHLQIEVVVEEG